MPAGHDPVAADAHGNQVVEVQGNDGRSSAGRPAEDQRAVIAPLEMAAPALPARIEECDDSARQGIAAARFRALEQVAGMAGQPEVGIVVRAAGGQRHDVFDFQRPGDVILMGQAIAAAVAGLGTNSQPALRRGRSGAHEFISG